MVWRPKTLRKRAYRLIFGVRSQFPCEAPAGRAAGSANLGSVLKNARVRPHPPTPCGRAEQRRLGRIKILDARRLRSRQVSKISGPAEQRKESRSDPAFGSPFLCLLSFGEVYGQETYETGVGRHRKHFFSAIRARRSPWPGPRKT